MSAIGTGLGIIVKAGVTSLLAEPAGRFFASIAGDVSQRGVALLPKLFRRSELDPLDAIARRIEGDLIAFAHSEHIAEARMLGLADTALAAMRDHGPTGAALVDDARLNADTATEKVFARARFDRDDKTVCRLIVETIYRVLLNDREQIAGLTPAFYRAVLAEFAGLRDLIGTLPAAIAGHGRRLLGAALLRPPARLRYVGREISSGLMLDAQFGDLPLHGRDGLVASVRDWTTSGAVGIRLYTGPGGIGKTRLFLEICRVLEACGWRAGFLASESETAGLNEGDWSRLLDDQRPLFIVVDYAETRRDLGHLFAVAATALHRGTPAIRIVLLARSAADWWANCGSIGGVQVQALLRGGATSPEPISLPPVEVPEARAIFAEAAAAFRTALAPDSAGNWPALPVPDLSAAHFGNPLMVRIAALLAVETWLAERSPPPAGAMDSMEKLLDWVIDRERRLWHTALRADAEDWLDAFAQAAALVTLTGGADQAGADRLLAGAPLLADAGRNRRHRIARRLAQQIHGPRFLNPLTPDLLGEHLAGREIDHEPRLGEIALRLEETQMPGHNTLTVLNRLAHRQPDREALLARTMSDHLGAVAETAVEVAIQSGDPIGRVLAGVLERRPDPDLSRRLLAKVPWETVALRELAAEAARQAVAAARAAPQPWSVGHQAILANLLNDLAHRLSRLGDRERALATMEEAADLYRRLAAARPDAFQPELATALNNLGYRLSDLGRRKDALAAAAEAVTIRRRLATDRPDAFLPDLATALNNLGNALSGLGRWEEALAAAAEAADVYSRLAEDRPDAFLPDLATALNNLGITLGDLGRREDALAVTEEAVAIRRLLAADRPDAFLPDLALALNNLGNSFSDLGRREDALAATEEAADLYRLLAADRPDAFLPDLALALNNLGIMLNALGRREDALAAIGEGADLYRRLAADRPDAFLPDLAAALNNLSNRLGALGRREDALAAIGEAADLYRRLAADHPDAFLPGLARALNNLGAMLSAFGRREDALAAIGEAADVYRRLAADRPDAFLPDLAAALNNLGIMLSNLGRREDARAAAAEAADLCRRLAADCPDAFLPDLARSLGALGACHRAAGNFGAAHDAFCEGIVRLRPLFLALPAAHARLMATLVEYYRDTCARLGREPDADLLAPIVAALEALAAERDRVNRSAAAPPAH